MWRPVGIYEAEHGKMVISTRWLGLDAGNVSESPDPNRPEHIRPTWTSINKVRIPASVNNSRYPETGHEYFEVQKLIEDDDPGRFYVIVDEQVQYRACAQDLVDGVIVFFLTQGCIKLTESWFDPGLPPGLSP